MQRHATAGPKYASLCYQACCEAALLRGCDVRQLLSGLLRSPCTHAVIKLWSGEADASGELSAAGSFTAANFEPTAQMPVDELFSHIGELVLF